MPKGKKKISKREFIQGFGGEAIEYLESLPAGERAARIEAFGKSVLTSGGRDTAPTNPTVS